MAESPKKPDLPESTLRVMERVLHTPPKPREAPKGDKKQRELKLKTRKPRADKE